jgi:hypothetical protein
MKSKYNPHTQKEKGLQKKKNEHRIHECRKKLKQTCRPSETQQSGSSEHTSRI